MTTLPAVRPASYGGVTIVPAVIADAGEHAARRFVEFFTANIRNANTRAAYATAVGLFMAWCEEHRLSIHDLEPVAVSAYVEQLMLTRSAPTVKQHLAAIRMLFDWLVVGQVMPMNRRPRSGGRSTSSKGQDDGPLGRAGPPPP